MAEAKINLAIQAIKQDQFQSVWHATIIYNVPQTSLRQQRAGILPKRNYKPKSKKLTKLKETVIYNYIINLDKQGFAPTLNAIQVIADRLLSKRGSSLVGINWPTTFVNRTPSIKTYINRPYN